MSFALGATVPGLQPPRQVPPDNCHPHNYHLGQLPPWTIAIQDTATCDNCHLEQLPSSTAATPDNCHPVKCHLGQLPPSTTAI